MTDCQLALLSLKIILFVIIRIGATKPPTESMEGRVRSGLEAQPIV